ncbi:MAG: ABC transporter substrate-binding protein [Anaerolineae bacterium]
MKLSLNRLFFLILLVLLLGVGVVGAQDEGGDAQNNMGVSLNPEVSGDVEFWHFWGSPVRRNAIQRVIGMCEQALPNIQVTEVFKPWGDIWTANIAAVAAQSGMPDVIVEDRPQLPRLAADGIEQSLQDYADRDGVDGSRFWPFTWEQTLYEGNTYGIPFETDVRVLYYNRSLFEQAGLDPNDPPETWEEVWAYADALDMQNADGEYQRIGFFPLMNVGADIWAQTTGHQWIQDGRPVINSPEVVETLNWIQQWVERYGGWDNIQEFRANFSAPPNDAFMSGRVAMFADIAGYSSVLNFYNPQITLDDGTRERLEWGVALLPYASEPSSASGGFALSIPTGAENPDAAWEFIKCATSPAAQASWARDTYAIPSDIEAANDPVLLADPNWAFFIEAMETSVANPLVAEYPNWGEQLAQRYERIWQGELSPEQAVEEAQSAVDEVVPQNS